jgi:ATP-dependent exoDNAse (exonuclease V) beta subunit
MLIDAQARAQALDPTQSFIVQAPAGSGKTELLTQRFLRLLSLVTQPEQIVALTFTRKAANEMRARVMQALLNAQQDTTNAYARAALARSAQYDWQLLTMPSRLRITTIDSLCNTLAQAIPLYEQHTPFAQINTAPEELYLKASQGCFQTLLTTPEYQPLLHCLLSHLDNRHDRLISLFVDQLRSRDQWLRIIHQAKLQDKSHYEMALAAIITHELECFKTSIPYECMAPLMTLSREVSEINPRFIALRDWITWDTLNPLRAKTLASLVLTGQGKLRKAFDHHVGLKNAPQLKQDSKALLALLEQAPDFLPALLRIQYLPDPHYQVDQWPVLQALLTTLPLLAAHLQLLFNERNQVDFIAIAQQASLALGEEDAPTDLALYLDHHIQHVLIDEFQDTSIQQFELLSQLVAGFDSSEHKTVFVVGDPMQSIYRFRGAEVGLFLRAKHYGIGPVKLNFLALQCNFRSNQALVTWINQQFNTIFPTHDDLESGAIAFHPATAVKQDTETPAVHAYSYDSREQQAQGLVQLIYEQLAQYPEQNIALLIRSRSQLKPIIRALREHHIPYQGTEIDCIAALPHIRDVWSLTQALLMPANRLAWLSFLRSPWCGLLLADLHALAQINRKQSIALALTQLDAHVAHFSHEGLTRLRFVAHVLLNALSTRGQQSLVDWIINTLQQLHATALLTPRECEELEQYWQLIAHFEIDGQLSDLTRVKHALDGLYSKSTTSARLHILTIHKAKGLEFDCVILPSLSSRPNAPAQPLLRWLTLPTTTQEPLVLLSPLHAATDTPNPLYDYLGLLDNSKGAYEQQRLLYVAVTRAKHRLFLLDFAQTPARHSLRGLLTDQPFTPISTENTESTEQPVTHFPLLQALPLHFYQQTPALLSSLSTQRAPAPTLQDPSARLLGVAAHELLQWICTVHPTQVSDIPRTLIHNIMQHHGVEDEPRLMELIIPLFTHPRGQWLIAPHTEEHNEYELLIHINHDVRTLIIDRTFIDQDKRWIIDFKTGREDPASTQEHQAQVNGYAKALAPYTPQPLCCGIYYLASQHWVEWTQTTWE